MTVDAGRKAQAGLPVIDCDCTPPVVITVLPCLWPSVSQPWVHILQQSIIRTRLSAGETYTCKNSSKPSKLWYGPSYGRVPLTCQGYLLPRTWYVGVGVEFARWDCNSVSVRCTEYGLRFACAACQVGPRARSRLPALLNRSSDSHQFRLCDSDCYTILKPFHNLVVRSRCCVSFQVTLTIPFDLYPIGLSLIPSYEY